MEKTTPEISIRKIFDLKMKQGHEIKKGHIDEGEFLRTFYFLKGTRVYVIDIVTKKIDELEFTKGKEVLMLTGSMNSEHMLLLMKNGSIYAIDSNNNVKLFKNLSINSISNKKIGKTLSNSNPSAYDNIRIFSSANLDKIVLSDDSFISIWYQSDLMAANSNQKTKIQNKSSIIEELTGTFYNISLENEKKTLLSQVSLTNTQETSSTNSNIYENLAATFGSNYCNGSYTKIVYVLMLPVNIDQYQLVLIDYQFKYDLASRLKAADYENANENLSTIDKKVLYTYLNYSIEKSKDNIDVVKNKDRIIIKFNNSGNSCVIVVNNHYSFNSYLVMYHTDTYNFSVCKLLEFYKKGKLPKNEGSILIWVEDITWVSDKFIVVLFSCGYFAILNINLQLIRFVDISNSIYTINKSCEEIACPINLYNKLLKFSDKVQLLSAKKRGDFFLIISNEYTVCYQIIHKNYESNLVGVENFNSSFDDFLYLVKYFQMFSTDLESELFDKIHVNIVKCLKELYHIDSEITTMPNENILQIFRVFVKFIKIFRSTNLKHETNLTIISYLIGISNDFFNHLLNFKEIWLAFVFIGLCESYLIKHLKLKLSRNKLENKRMLNNEASYFLFNPFQDENSSFINFSKLSNKILFSRQRLILIFFSLMEFRNSQALNINVLYFVLAKQCIDKMKKENLLDDIHLLVKILIKNWKLLKNENERTSRDDFVLNALTVNNRNEVLSDFLNSRYPRTDLKFQFFREFFSIEDLQSFNDLYDMYSKGGEENLINEYNYMNNLAVIQKWILFFTNYFYGFLFEDVKNYLNNHILKFHNAKKKIENISPEETNLSNLIYFNFTFFMLVIKNYLNSFLRYMTSKSETSSESNFISEDPFILNNFGKVFLPFISPVDIPFAILEFYSIEDNKQKKILPHEINQNLNDLIKRYFKNFNISLNDSFDFGEFLINIGFIVSNNYNENDTEIPQANKIQKILLSTFVLYIFIIHKLSQLHFFLNEHDLILSIISNLEMKYKSDAYELIFLIMNGVLKYYLQKENIGKLNVNNSKYLEIVLSFIKTIFYKILREEPFYVRRNIHEFINVTPSSLKSYLIEGALFYEYRNFSNLVKSCLFDSKKVLELNNPSNATENLYEQEHFNLFNEIFKEAESETEISHALILEKIFNLENVKNNKIFIDNFIYALYNLLMLTKAENNLIFSLEANRDYIRNIICGIDNDSKRKECNEKSFSDSLSSSIDKIIKGNFDNKAIFKFSCNQLKTKLTRSIKIVIAKFLHIMVLFDAKYHMLTVNPTKDILNYLKYLSFCLVCGKESTVKEDINSGLKIIDFLMMLDINGLTKSEESNFIDVITHLNILFIKIGKDFISQPIMIKLEEKVKAENINLYAKLKDLSKSNGLIKRIKSTHDNLSKIKSSNLKMFLVLCNSDFYIDNLFRIVNQQKVFVTAQQAEAPLNRARHNYIKFSEAFMNLTGVPVKAYIDFEENWNLINDEVLFNFIVHGDIQEVKYESNSDFSEFKSSNQNLIINTRQMSGFDTPRSRNKKINLNHLNNNLEEADKKNSVNPLDISISKNDLNKSIEIREENNEENSKNRNKISIATKMKTKTYKKNSILPKYGDKRFVRSSTLKSESVNLSKSEDKDQSIVTIYNEKDSINERTSINKNTSLLLTRLRKSFFENLKSKVFSKFKKESASKELEQIKIINIKQGEGIIDMIVLTEKFVPDNEIIIGPADILSNRLANFNTIIQESHSVIDLSQRENRNKDKFRPFDLINIKRVKPGKGDSSALYKELLKKKNSGNVQQIIKNKIEEIQDKLKKYEEMAMNLEKEFKASFD